MSKKEIQEEKEEILDTGEVPENQSEQQAQSELDVPRVPVIRQLSIALGLLILVFGTTYVDEITDLFEPEEEINTATASDLIITQTLEEAPNDPVDYFATTNILARSAFVWDVKAQKVLYYKNADEQLPLASLTKLMTALVAYELLDPEERIDISTEAINELGDSGLTSGEKFSLRNLTDLTLIASSNDGAHALAAAAGSSIDDTVEGAELFVRAMNIRADDIGLTQTQFKNSTGLDISEFEEGAYGSARDMAFLMEFIVTEYPELLEGTVTEYISIPNENGEAHFTQNTNEAIAKIDGIIASKTGYTDLAGGNLVVAFNAGLNRPIIVSVLGSSREGRFDDVVKLVERARKTIAESN